MTSPTINTTAGQTIARELLVAYLNTGTAGTPVWSPLGTRVEDSSADYDWGDETKKDILGNTHSTMKKPVITQSFDPCNLDSGDAAIVKVWELAVRDQDAQALCTMDVLVVHTYAGTSGAAFAERYPSSMVKPTGLGGPGGGSIEMPIDITFGGARSTGTAAIVYTYAETADESPVEGKTYYTKSGTVYTEFTGTSFASGTTYYERTGQTVAYTAAA